MIKATTLALCAFALSGCQSVKINGYEITKETQIVGGVVGIALATAIAYAARDADPEPEKLACKRYLAPPPGKGSVGAVCSIPLD